MGAALLIAVLVVAAIFIPRRFCVRSKTDAKHTSVRSLQGRGATNSADATDGEVRAKCIAECKPAPPIALESIGEIDRDQDVTTYWAAYEMILPGL
jgi:hypothetical protein